MTSERKLLNWSIRCLHTVDDAQIDALADVLIDCVEGGASVSFMLPLTRDRAVAFWRRVANGAAAGERALLVAEDQHGICGTVQLIFDLPENQPQRADLAKMLVHRRARRQGLGAALMRGAEDTARQCGKTLLVLDAVTDGDAARLYERLGWVRVGDVPNFALMPRGEPCSTTYYYRDLLAPSQSEISAKASGRQTLLPVEFKIRTATIDDCAAVYQLLRELDGYHVLIRPDVFQPFDDPIGQRERIAQFVNQEEAELIVAEINADLVGLATVRKSDNPQASMFRPGLHACVDDLFVNPKFRRMGIAKALLGRVTEWTKARQLRWIEINVWNANQSGMSFFKAYGFTPRCQKMQFEIDKVMTSAHPQHLQSPVAAEGLDTTLPAIEVRTRAGLIVLNEQQRVLLFLHADGYGRKFWATPGGGVEPGETVEQAAHREAAEELGANQVELTLLWTGHSDFLFADRQVSQDETYFLVACRPEMLGSQVIDVHRREGIQEVRWWSLEDIAMAESSVFPVDLAE